ncbi:hypothetical protein [Pseudoxanthomonas dokdonensis]|uniref:Uncharacterized protein n=1 Tax=Pseudoxanthomonas dokdonensis TaxID=344882 RepID=A0A0R0CTU6_9GAMM|nr:hypothetical protein [Pseudoxanthomonas dokdonensis]KRG69044.1 hypothetical protein ABB29_11455 [Pseudoxanthomonas dokdonensis]
MNDSPDTPDPTPTSDDPDSAQAPPVASLIHIEFVDGVPHAHPRVAIVHAGDTIVWFTDPDCNEEFSIQLLDDAGAADPATKNVLGRERSSMADATSAAAPMLSRPRQTAILQLGLEMAQTNQTYMMRGVWPKGEDPLPPGGGTSQAIIIVKPPRMSLDDE